MEKLLKEMNIKKQEFEKEIEMANCIEVVENLAKKYAKKYIKELYSVLAQEKEKAIKKTLGKEINDMKKYFEDIITLKRESLKKEKEAYHACDITISKNSIKRGRIHPLIQLEKKIEDVFIGMGFTVAQGPEIELDKYNFEMLNMPKHHPARDMQDTFYVDEPNVLLRSHTSCVQVRTMEKIKPPIKIISPGTVYRVDDIDPQHTPMFYQMEGLVVGENITFANLKNVLTTFIRSVFGKTVEVRFRPSYYPYTEPSAAIDMSCIHCNKKGCRVCNNSGWITILGAGMVDPNVFKAVGYDDKEYTGFAFGLGLNRLALIYYELSEIRKFYENDVSLWEQL